jgi:hypothetical protein
MQPIAVVESDQRRAECGWCNGKLRVRAEVVPILDLPGYRPLSLATARVRHAHAFGPDADDATLAGGHRSRRVHEEARRGVEAHDLLAGPHPDNLRRKELHLAEKRCDRSVTQDADRSRQGVPICSIRPARITAIRSDRCSASP